jgi:hypothetical protein
MFRSTYPPTFCAAAVARAFPVLLIHPIAGVTATGAGGIDQSEASQLFLKLRDMQHAMPGRWPAMSSMSGGAFLVRELAPRPVISGGGSSSNII